MADGEPTPARPVRDGIVGKRLVDLDSQPTGNGSRLGNAGSQSELVARCKAGDVAALEALYRRYVECVWGWAWFRTQSHDAAGEIVQETFLRVARSIGQFKERSSFGTWLFAITRSVAIDFTRRRRRDRAVRENPKILRLIRPSTDPPEVRADDEVRVAVRAAVAALPRAQRDAIVLCELSGLSIRDAAAALGWTESRMKVTLFRARRKLRDRLAPHVENVP